MKRWKEVCLHSFVLSYFFSFDLLVSYVHSSNCIVVAAKRRAKEKGAKGKGKAKQQQYWLHPRPTVKMMKMKLLKLWQLSQLEPQNS